MESEKSTGQGSCRVGGRVGREHPGGVYQCCGSCKHVSSTGYTALMSKSDNNDQGKACSGYANFPDTIRVRNGYFQNGEHTKYMYSN